MAVNAKGEEITSIWTPANIVTCVHLAGQIYRQLLL